MGLSAEIVLDNEEKKKYSVELDQDGEYSLEDFKSDVAEKVEEEFMEELEMEKPFDLAAAKKLSAANLKKKLVASDEESLEHKILSEALASKQKKPAAKPKKADAKPKGEKKPKAEKPKKELTKEQQERKGALDEVKASKEYKSAKKNLGKTASFTGKRSKKKTKGEIKGLSLSKDLKRIYYTVKTKSGITCVSTDNETLELE